MEIVALIIAPITRIPVSLIRVVLEALFKILTMREVAKNIRWLVKNVPPDEVESWAIRMQHWQELMLPGGPVKNPRSRRRRGGESRP